MHKYAALRPLIAPNVKRSRRRAGRVSRATGSPHQVSQSVSDTAPFVARRISSRILAGGVSAPVRQRLTEARETPIRRANSAPVRLFVQSHLSSRVRNRGSFAITMASTIRAAKKNATLFQKDLRAVCNRVSVTVMNAAEIRIALENRRDADLRRAAQMDEGAAMYEGAAIAEGVGYERRAVALETALRFAENAKRARRNAEVLDAALLFVPTFEVETP